MQEGIYYRDGVRANVGQWGEAGIFGFKSVFFHLQDLCLLLSSLWPRNVPAERPLSHHRPLFIFDKALTLPS